MPRHVPSPERPAPPSPPSARTLGLVAASLLWTTALAQPADLNAAAPVREVRIGLMADDGGLALGVPPLDLGAGPALATGSLPAYPAPGSVATAGAGPLRDLPAARLAAAAGGSDSTASPGRFSRWFVDDVFGLVGDVHLGPVALGLGVAGGVALLSLSDAALSDVARTRFTGPVVPVLNAVNYVGSPYALAAAAVLWGGTLLAGGDRAQDAAFTSVQAGVYSVALSTGIKVLVGRSRPSADAGPFEFHPFSVQDERNSFPSGHATLAFALLTPWVVYHPNVATYGLLVVATGTAVARVALARHWPSDVLAGAFIGGAVGYGLARRHLDRTEGTTATRAGPDIPMFHLAFRL